MARELSTEEICLVSGGQSLKIPAGPGIVIVKPTGGSPPSGVRITYRIPTGGGFGGDGGGGGTDWASEAEKLRIANDKYSGIDPI
jgi:hypothetical protein